MFCCCGKCPEIDIIIYVIVIIQKLMLTSVCGIRNVSAAEFRNCETVDRHACVTHSLELSHIIFNI